MKGFEKRLAQARRQCAMTQAEVAEKLNVSFQAVSQWERGETAPDIGKLPELAAVLHVTTDYLLMGRDEDPVVLDIQNSLSDRLFSEEHMYTYVKTYALAKGMLQTVRVLPYAKEKHRNQLRRGKDHVPYIYHPLQVACHALALGLEDDDLVSAALLHDVCEDCDVAPEELPVNERTRRAVSLLTREETPGMDWEEIERRYYGAITHDPLAAMIKLMDRCSNVSGMAAGFTKAGIVRYIQSTEKWIYPLLQQTRELYPQYSNQLFLIKYHLTSVVETIKHQL